ncbi:DNA replication factor Dna2-domain-containing protein [Pilobolus umbonatus]|nr:DNA replication factor Dna2-domain-containing protein [Pilobolus umbonatus]
MTINNGFIPHVNTDARKFKRFKSDRDLSSKPVQQQQNVLDEDDESMFGDDINMDDLDITQLFTKKSVEDTFNDIFGDDIPIDELDKLINDVENSSVQERPSKYIRYSVIDVSTRSYISKENIEMTEKVLYLVQEDVGIAATAYLRDEWRQTVVMAGDIVHIPHKQRETSIIIDDKQNYIIVHPDRLISCTAVADSFTCLRKSVLQSKISSVSKYSEALVHGNIIHRVIQNCFESDDFSIQFIKEEMKQVVTLYLEELYAFDQDEETALSVLEHYAQSIYDFGSTYVGKKPKPQAQFSDSHGGIKNKELGYGSVAITNILDIEEHLWSPTYGLKGMIDVTVQAKISPLNKTLTLPFELKTGKLTRFLTNRAQALLYTLLMCDKYDIDVDAALLYYSKSNSLYLIPAARNDLKSLIISRNSLAFAMNDQKTIPGMLRDFHTCQYCYLNDACIMYHKAMENGTGLSSGLYDFFDKKTEHLTDSASSFLKTWWKLLDNEDTDIDYIKKDIWSQPAEYREMGGRCLANMLLNLPKSQIDRENNIWKYCFVKEEPGKDKSLMTIIIEGDPIVISTMDGHTNLALGYALRVSTTEILVGLKEPLRNPPLKDSDFDSERNQTYHSHVQNKANAQKYYSHSKIKYRIDKDEMSSGMNMLRNNLVLLVQDYEDPHQSRLRDLIVDLAKPRFQQSLSIQLPVDTNLNGDQQLALKRVVQAEDYSLILGMPGTGKTTVTAEIIKYLVSQNKTVLIAAYTHTALDNVLIKVREHGIDILRLGNIEKFVLVGDMYQLPPIVRRSNALTGGLDKSLFSILAESNPNSISYLEYQYRMNKDVMDIANLLVYDHKLKCGNYSVATRKLTIPNFESGMQIIHQEAGKCSDISSCWLNKILDPE